MGNYKQKSVATVATLINKWINSLVFDLHLDGGGGLINGRTSLIQGEFHFLQCGNNLGAFRLCRHHDDKYLNDDCLGFLQAKLQNGQKFGDNFVECRVAAFCSVVLVALVDT